MAGAATAPATVDWMNLRRCMKSPCGGREAGRATPWNRRRPVEYVDSMASDMSIGAFLDSGEDRNGVHSFAGRRVPRCRPPPSMPATKKKYPSPGADRTSSCPSRRSACSRNDRDPAAATGSLVRVDAQRFARIGRTPARGPAALAEYHMVEILRGTASASPSHEHEQLLVLETRRELERLIAARARPRLGRRTKTLAAMAQALLAAGQAGESSSMLRQYSSLRAHGALRRHRSRSRRSRRSTPCRAASTSCTTELDNLRDVARIHAECCARSRPRREGGGGGLRPPHRFRRSVHQRIITRDF